MKLMIVLLVAGFTSVAGAEQFWAAWEGDDYPEQDGWERITYGGGAERRLEDGSLVLDGLASTSISDFYGMGVPSEPDAGEMFVLQWRLRVDEMHGFADPAMSVDSSHGFLTLRYTEESIYSSLEGIWIDFAPGDFHDYALTSTDMESYSLYIDGELAHVGQFVGPALDPRVTWGDYTQGARSLSTWDYVRFGIVPEPSTSLLLGFGGLVVILRRTRRTARYCHENV